MNPPNTHENGAVTWLQVPFDMGLGVLFFK